jgi:hypothetical protein
MRLNYKHCCPSLITMEDHTDYCLSRQEKMVQLQAEVERLRGRIDRLQFTLTQARIVLEHFGKMIPNPEHRKWAQGRLVASDVDADERTKNTYR